MQMKGFVNFAFALFAALLLAGAMFAIGQTDQTQPVASSQNRAPVITGVGGPTSLAVGQAGTWSISAYDPEGGALAYLVDWGEVTSGAVSEQQTATFQHTYYSAGTYTITFTAKDSAGKTTQATITAVVSQASPSGLSMTTWAEPDVQGVSYGLYAKVLDNRQVPSSAAIRVTGTVKTPSGETLTTAMGLVGQGSPYANQGVYGWGFGNTMPCGTYTYTVTAQKILSTANGGVATDSQSGAFVLSSPYCQQAGLQVGSIWMEPDPFNYGDMVLLAKVTYNGQPADMEETSVYFTLTDTRGITSAPMPVGYNCQIQEYCPYNYYGMGMGSLGMPCGTMKLVVKAEGYGQTATGSETLTLSPPYCGEATTQCDGFSKLSAGGVMDVSGTSAYNIKLQDISADSNHAAMIQVLDANNAVLEFAKVAPGTTYVYASTNPTGTAARVAVEACNKTSVSVNDDFAWKRHTLQLRRAMQIARATTR